ncbi:hypothetical protein FKM82_022561 [Ascaphus truei]
MGTSSRQVLIAACAQAGGKCQSRTCVRQALISHGCSQLCMQDISPVFCRDKYGHPNLNNTEAKSLSIREIIIILFTPIKPF